MEGPRMNLTTQSSNEEETEARRDQGSHWVTSRREDKTVKVLALGLVLDP